MWGLENTLTCIKLTLSTPTYCLCLRRNHQRPQQILNIHYGLMLPMKSCIILLLGENTGDNSWKASTSAREGTSCGWLWLTAGFLCCSVNTGIILDVVLYAFKEDKYTTHGWVKLFWSSLTLKIHWQNFPLYFKCCFYIIDEPFSHA